MELMEDGNLMDKVNVLIQRDMEYYNKNQSILQEKLCSSVIGGRLDFPPSSSFAAIKLVNWWEEEYLAAFRKGSGFMKPSNEDLIDDIGGGCGGIVQTSNPEKFISAITKSAEQILTHLHVLTQEALDHADLTVLNGTIGAASLIKNCIWCYISSKINETDELQTILKNYQEMCEALAERLLDLHCRLLSLYILQDAECLDWENEKPFFESERGSYILQMWWLYMMGTMDDLWETVPPKMAQRVFAGMLNETLTIFTVRYGQVIPSENRSKLYSVDISNLLLCIGQLLPSICNDSEELVGLFLNNQSKILRDVHIKSQELFSFFIMRTSPLDFLMKIFRKGTDNLDLSKNKSNTIIPWIIFALPNIFQQEQIKSISKIDDFDDNTAIALDVMVLSLQPQPNWCLLLKVLCMRNCKISKIILEETLSDSGNYSKKNLIKCNRFLCSEICTASIKLDLFEIISSITHIFLIIGNKFDLEEIFLPLIIKHDNWGKCFDRREIWNQNRPPFFEALIENIQETLPPISKTVINAVQTGASMYQAMSIVLACFSQLWDCINKNIVIICNLFQENLSSDIIPIGNSVLLQLLLSGLYSDLLKISESENKKVKIKETPILSQHKNSLTSFDGFNNSNDAIALAVGEALCSIDEDNKHTEQIVEFLKQVNDELEENVMDGCKKTESTHEVVEVLCSELLSDLNGKRSLKILLDFIKNNSDFLNYKLGILDVKSEAIYSKKYPSSLLHTMFHIGYRPFDKFLSGHWKPNWNQLLTTPMGLTPERIWLNLSYRWEFKDSNFYNLANNEAQIVSSLTSMLKQQN